MPGFRRERRFDRPHRRPGNDVAVETNEADAQELEGNAAVQEQLGTQQALPVPPTPPAAPPPPTSVNRPIQTRGGFVQAALRALGRQDPVESVLSGRLDEALTRGEAAVVASRLLGLGDALDGQPATFSDVPLSHWAATAIYRCREEGILAGNSDGTFKPGDALGAAAAASVVQRLANPGARTPFDRTVALSQASTASSQAATDQQQVELDTFRSMSQYEGGDPALLHYDSARVNVGRASWTGGRIAELMDGYVRVAEENGITATLYGYFGGQRAYEAIQARFRRDGTATTLTHAEEAAFRQAGGNAILAGAQDAQGAADVQVYLGEIKGFSPAYPYVDAAGSISELAAVVFSHAANQHGNATDVYRHVMAANGNNAAHIRDTVPERTFLLGVKDTIVSWVGAAYKEGVRNRYDGLFAAYGTSTRYYLGALPSATRLQGQLTGPDGKGLAGRNVTVTGPDARPVTVTTAGGGLFELGATAPLREGRYTVVPDGGTAQTADVRTGATAWLALTGV
jgi:hypothetical protein